MNHFTKLTFTKKNIVTNSQYMMLLIYKFETLFLKIIAKLNFYSPIVHGLLQKAVEPHV